MSSCLFFHENGVGWLRKSPEFNLHPLRKIFAVFEIGVPTPNSGIRLYIRTKCSVISFSTKSLSIKLLVLSLYKLFVKTWKSC